MKSVDIESQTPVPNVQSAFNPINIITIICLVLYLLTDILFMPVIIYNLVTSISGFSNILEFLLMVVIMLTKYSQLGIQIYGIFFDSKKEARSTLSLVSLLLTVTIGVLFLSWAIMLIANGGNVLMILTDPIILYLMLGTVLSIPGLISLYLS
jgi:hypothetical protein